MTVPNIQSDEEIEILTRAGDRREIDKLLLHKMNSLIATLSGHIIKEEPILAELGTPEDIALERAFIRQLLKREEDRAKMRKKVIESATMWAIPLICMFLWGAFSTGLREKVSQWLAPANVEQKK